MMCSNGPASSRTGMLSHCSCECCYCPCNADQWQPSVERRACVPRCSSLQSPSSNANEGGQSGWTNLMVCCDSSSVCVCVALSFPTPVYCHPATPAPAFGGSKQGAVLLLALARCSCTDARSNAGATRISEDLSNVGHVVDTESALSAKPHRGASGDEEVAALPSGS